MRDSVFLVINKPMHLLLLDELNSNEQSFHPPFGGGCCRFLFYLIKGSYAKQLAPLGEVVFSFIAVRALHFLFYDHLSRREASLGILYWGDEGNYDKGNRSVAAVPYCISKL